MLGALPLAARPLFSIPRLPRAYQVAAVDGEYGWAAWSFSRQAKLNAWSWHGMGNSSVHGWATLGNCVYVRKEEDNYVHVLQPDVYLAADDTSSDSTSVEATTQWLDFGKPGRLKALTGLDFDGVAVQTVEVYISVDGSRSGELAASLDVGGADGGWTYNGAVIPVEAAATEFKLRFVGAANEEVQINRLTLYFDELQG